MIFVIEDEAKLLSSVIEYLEGTGEKAMGFERAEDALEAARRSPPDVVVSDVQLPGMGGLEGLDEIAKIDPGIVRIVMTANASVQTAVRAMRSGCYEYLEKPIDLEQLSRTIQRAIAGRRAGRELAWLRGSNRAQVETAQRILGESRATQHLRDQIQKFGALGSTSPPILIIGETGVGKGLVARAIHSARFGSEAPWIDINCAALPKNLIESELFGFERSAFTDAKQAKPGLFEAAAGGTVFLDEIGELDLEIQTKLLKVVESGTVRRLGSVTERPARVCLIAATNVDLEEATRKGTFRADLYHRLAALTLTVPPLRERGEDVTFLAGYFLRESAARYKKRATTFSPDALDILQRAPWRGNIRELRFAVERSVIMAADDTPEITGDLLEVKTGDDTKVANNDPAVLATTFGIRVQLPEEGISFAELERAILAAALKRTGGNVVRAADLLGLKRDAVRYRIKKLGLDDLTR